jgi:lipoprotein-anchoring transpeptidase ErfK/SrfK
MKSSLSQKLFLSSLLILIAALITGCSTSHTTGSYNVRGKQAAPRQHGGHPNEVSNYNPIAHQPTNPANVRVKVSLKEQMIYVMEGDKPLLVTATTVGRPDKPTPKGNFRVTKKEANRRSYTYGFWVNQDEIRAGKSIDRPPGKGWRYVGYPMPYWVEFMPAYGFHEGYVWPIPRTHGCLRLHKNASKKFFDLVRIGTPINISDTQPEDATLGRNAPRPSDYRDPDPPASFMISPAVFRG